MAIEKDTIVKGAIILIVFSIVFLGAGKQIMNAMEKGIALTKGQLQEYIGSNPADVSTQNSKDIPTDARNAFGVDVKPLINYQYFGNVVSAPRRNGQEPSKIVLHHTGGSTASGAISALKTRDLSVHYVIDKNGIIYYLVNEDRAAFHCGCCWPSQRTCCGKESCFVCITDNPVANNHDSIGIEIVNTGNYGDKYADAQYASLKKLLADIYARREIPIDNQHVFAHYQISPDKWDPSPNFDWEEIGLTKPEPPGNVAPPVPAGAGYP